jgi:hypothetical protein
MVRTVAHALGYGRAVSVSMRPVVVTASPEAAGKALLALLSDEYGATGEFDGERWTLTISPIDDLRRGTIIYRVIQASRTVDARYPGAQLHLITEDGNRWRLPPPEL